MECALVGNNHRYKNVTELHVNPLFVKERSAPSRYEHKPQPVPQPQPQPQPLPQPQPQPQPYCPSCEPSIIVPQPIPQIPPPNVIVSQVPPPIVMQCCICCMPLCATQCIMFGGCMCTMGGSVAFFGK
ncbi:unnamed protein product [Strongylus vulgaris]|uniref:Uncharacterized protein n=1 Tax=Strongylus vulgaris TaxID=40348 RepID=A0A3P7L9H6_STRVU|nr:unnamed protein product [Strongylus vulgaris]